MKRSYSAFAEDIPPYSGPKAARDSYADLKQLSAIPGHIYTRPELQILPLPMAVLKGAMAGAYARTIAAYVYWPLEGVGDVHCLCVGQELQ
ncbi:hypothetical protein Taro_040009 [Colocasia esculenta]|uniref:Uncharacterized protein n=1 Tax=Colocasia esculenta TaxID=4460 RepID=A0A843WKJ0_COLES|nr:hypothetical protein [Colocasia esculenta]